MDINDILSFDKSIIQIDTNSAIWNDSTNMSFYIDILEPIKNVLYITIIKSSITVLDATENLNGSPIIDLDPVYINLNNYNRLISTYTNNNNKNILNYFEIIPLNLTDKYPTIHLNYNKISFTNSYVSTGTLMDSHLFKLNPIEPNLKRFNIDLYDKNNNILKQSEISRFTMTLCVYYNKKKYTMS
jgi:hypothetical protein